MHVRCTRVCACVQGGERECACVCVCVLAEGGGGGGGGGLRVHARAFYMRGTCTCVCAYMCACACVYPAGNEGGDGGRGQVRSHVGEERFEFAPIAFELVSLDRREVGTYVHCRSCHLLAATLGCISSSNRIRYAGNDGWLAEGGVRVRKGEGPAPMIWKRCFQS